MFLGAILAIWLAPGITTLFQKASLDMTAANIVFTVILVLGGSLTAVSYFLLCKKEDRMMGEFNLEATFGISFINEVLACFLKPLAFMAFYSLILGQSFTEATGFDYGALVAITAVFAMVNIPLNAYLLTLFCRRGQFLVRGSTYEKED